MTRPLPLPGQPKIPGLRLATGKGRTGTSGNDGSENLLIEFGTTQSRPDGAAVESISSLPADALEREWLASQQTGSRTGWPNST
jgi:hypothetical protein